MKHTLSLVLHFAVHILVGTALFCLLAAAAAFVDIYSNRTIALGAPSWMGLVCHGVAALLFIVDVICVCFFVLIQGFKLLNKIWEERLREP